MLYHDEVNPCIHFVLQWVWPWLCPVLSRPTSPRASSLPSNYAVELAIRKSRLEACMFGVCFIEVARQATKRAMRKRTRRENETGGLSAALNEYRSDSACSECRYHERRQSDNPTANILVAWDHLLSPFRALSGSLLGALAGAREHCSVPNHHGIGTPTLNIPRDR